MMETERDDRIPVPPEDQTTVPPEPAPAEEGGNQKDAEKKPPYQPYSRKARLWAWVGIAFMVFLVIMYTYAFSSGIILKY